MNPNALAWALAQPAGGAAAGLAAAYVGGTTRVAMDGRSVEYRSLSDIATALGALYAASGAAPRRPSSTLARVSGAYQ